MNLHRLDRFVGSFTFATLLLIANVSRADLITLTNGTATFSQDGYSYSPAEAVDGDYTFNNGWAVLGGDTTAQTAVWETTADLNVTAMEMQMYFLHGSNHLMGRFRFSVTTDDRSTFADGLIDEGDVSANWIVLTNPVVTGPDGMTFTVLGDNSVLPGGSIPETGIYTVNFSTAITGVTGLRLEAMTDPSLNDHLGFGGGVNFLLNELTVNAVPEPSSILLVGLSVAGLGLYRRSRKELVNVSLYT